MHKALLAFLALTSPAVGAAQSPQLGSAENSIAIPGATVIDHAGFTVPDLEQAVTFFVDVLGASVVWRVAPISGADAAETMRLGLNADPRATVSVAMLRLGPNLNVELLAYEIPGIVQTMPLNSALNVGHLGFVVTDIDVAGAYLLTKKVRMLQGPRKNARGPNAGQQSWFFLSPWGMAIELIERPPRMPYERETSVRLYEAPR